MSERPTPGTLPERPRLHPWCRVVRDGGRCLLEHGGTLVTLQGRAAETLLPNLLPLLDGTRTVDELIAALGRPVAPAVEHALTLLESNRLLVEGPGDRDESSAAVFAVGVGRHATAAFARRNLEGACITVLGSGDAAAEIARQLRAVHMRVGALPIDHEPEGDLVVAAPGVDEVATLARLNDRALARRLPWLQLLPFDGRIVVAGPLFLPGESGCRACFVLRRGACSGYEDDFDLVESEALKAAAPAPLIVIGAGLAAYIAVRWLATGDPTLPGRFYALEAGVVLRLSHAQALRVPRCAACGTPQRAVPSPWFEETA